MPNPITSRVTLFCVLNSDQTELTSDYRVSPGDFSCLALQKYCSYLRSKAPLEASIMSDMEGKKGGIHFKSSIHFKFSVKDITDFNAAFNATCPESAPSKCAIERGRT